MKSLKNNFTLILILLFLSSCSSKQKFEQALGQEDCEVALSQIPENESGYQLMSKSKQASGYVLSYSLTGAAYTADVLLYVAAGISYIMIACAPITATMIAFSMAGGHSSQNLLPSSQLCFVPEPFDIADQKWGSKTYKETENLRCPNLDGLSKSIRQVASCYQRQGTTEANQKALKTLQALENSGSFFSCVSSNEKEEVLALTRRIEENQ